MVVNTLGLKIKNLRIVKTWLDNIMAAYLTMKP
jgi:hypothetical protein